MKRIITLLASVALIASGLSILPTASALEAPEIPAVVQIDDPKGDANGVNDQDNAYGTPLAGQGDHVGPAGGTATDLLKVWFSNTATDVALHFQTVGNPGNLVYDTYFRFSSNAGTGSVAKDETRGCLQWVASINGAGGAYTGETEGTLTDKCNVGDAVAGPLVTSEGPDGTFITSITFPRSYSPLLAAGEKITAPFGVSRVLYVGPTPTTAAFVTLDNTKRGEDFAFVETAGNSGKTPPGKNDPPGEKKGCDKGMGKKRGCEGKGKKSPKPGKPSACAPFAPGEMGKDAKTTVVTDAATEDKPIEIDVPLGPATGNVGSDRTTRMKHNVQVDSTNVDAGLFARLEGPALDDPDLYVYWPSGSRAAVAGGFNPLLVAGPLPAAHPILAALNGTGSGGHSEFTAEQIDGLRTSDCQGWTLDLVNWAGRGGYTLELWLGEVQNEPAEEK